MVIGDVIELDDQAIQALVDSLRKEIFTAQKSVSGQILNSQALIGCISALSSALDGIKKESTSSSLIQVGNASKGSTIISKARPTFRLHLCSIVQSMYTLFTRVLAPPALKQIPHSTVVAAESEAEVSSTADGNSKPTNTNLRRADTAATSASKQLLVTATEQCQLKIQSLGLLASVAAYDPSRSLSPALFCHSLHYCVTACTTLLLTAIYDLCAAFIFNSCVRVYKFSDVPNYI
jgi:hypothetical protein